MSSLKAILIAAVTALALIIAISAFNFIVDPMCYYRCKEVEIARASSNSYYQAAQKVLAHPEVEQILLGSSRAGTTSPMWLEGKTGLKTLNLEVPGAELMAKLALLNLALKKTKIKRVIWYADYFEIIPDSIDEKLKGSSALRFLLPRESDWSETLDQMIKPNNPLATLIDQNTVAASLHTLKVDSLTRAKEFGGNSGEYSACDSPSYLGKESVASLNKKVDLLFENYSNKILKPAPSKEMWELFVKKIASLKSQGIEVLVVIIPYHPKFMSRLVDEFPAIYQRHKKWVSDVNSLTSSKKIRVMDYSSGIPGGDGSPKFWNDGVHFTCHGVRAMLKDLN